MTDGAPAPSTSFADQIDYDALFAEIETKKHITYSAADRQEFKDIATKHLKKWDGGKAINSGAGSTFVDIIKGFFISVQNLLSGLNFHDFFNSLGDIGKKTNKFNMLHDANTGTIELYEDLKYVDNGKFAPIAEAATGQKGITATDRSVGENFENCIFAQLSRKNALPAGGSSSLDNNNIGKQGINGFVPSSTIPNLKPNTGNGIPH